MLFKEITINCLTDRNWAEQKCADALEDLNRLFNNKLKKRDAGYWLIKYCSLNIALLNYPERNESIEKFRSTYCELNKLYKISAQDEKTSVALPELNSLDKSDENQLLDWLIKYEDWGLDLEPYKWNTCFEDYTIPETGLIPLKHNREIFLYAQEYKDIFNFLNLFSKNYWHYAQLYCLSNHNGYYEESGIKYYRESRILLSKHQRYA